MPIRAVTFDFWRTLFYASSKSKERKALRVRRLSALLGIPEESIVPAFKYVSNEFTRVHIVEQRTPPPSDAVPMLCAQLNIPVPFDKFSAVVDAITDTFDDHPPDMIPGARDAVRAAAALVPVGLISDTGLTPGTRLKKLLERQDMAQHFTAFTFSDEVGVAKPQSAMFHHAAHHLGVAPAELLHIGDLEPTDIAGAVNIGAFPALFAGDNTRYIEGTRARRVFRSWQEFIDAIPALIEESATSEKRAI
jgi:putative hydrolase of the HAD superfamily